MPCWITVKIDRRTSATARFPISVEKSAVADDGDRELLHVVLDDADLTRPPRLGQRRGRAQHRRGVGVHPIAVEGRLHHPPLPQVVLAVGQQQPGPQVRLELVEHGALAELGALGDHNFIGERWIGDEERVQGTEVQAHHLAVLVQRIGELRALREHRRGVPE
jgi:hypothetical protein